MTADDRDEAWRREAVLGLYAERPFAEPPSTIRIWSYADQLSYAAGETLPAARCRLVGPTPGGPEVPRAA